MITKRIVYSRPDGGVSVVNPMPEFVAGFPTEAEALVFIQAKDVPSDATNIEVMDQSLLPSREFRDAWVKLAPGVPTVNMPKARVIQAKKISNAKAKAAIVLQKRIDEATLDGRTSDATKATSNKTAIGGLNLTTIATQIAGAANPIALSATWPIELQEFKP